TSPWEVKVGDAVTGLDAQIQEGQKEANIAVNKAIPFLGIRTIESTAFQGQLGISPQIDFGNAVNVDAFENGRAPVTLEVKDADNAKIGTLTASMGASALTSVKGPWSGYNYNIRNLLVRGSSVVCLKIKPTRQTKILHIV
ncbi:TPA: hypothetical protein OMI19_005014, partial [Escherichia coli]|nr:hypothetical protein [Escherichia coli]